MFFRLTFCFALAILLCSVPGISVAQQFDKEFKRWSVFTLKHDGKKICYIATSPTKKTGNYKRRGEPYILVTHRSRNVDEVSVSSGYPYKNGSSVKLSIDKKKKYKLFTSKEVKDVAWAKDEVADKKIIKAMKLGYKMKVKANSRLKTYSLDSYSLMGFTKAYKRMKSLCK